MTKRVLIVGMSSFDSGKTQFAKKLATYAKDNGMNIEYFKPISGHSDWYRHEHTKKCLKESTIYSSDAATVRDVFQSQVSVKLANPVHRFMGPFRMKTPSTLSHHMLAAGGWESMFIMERVTRFEGGRMESSVLYAEKLVNDGCVSITVDDAQTLIGEADVVPVSSLHEVQVYEKKFFESAVQSCFSEIEKSADTVLIESFNDSVWPWDGLDMVDTVLVVGPGNVFEYDAERVRKASYLVKRKSGPIRELEFSRISEYLTPIRKLESRPIVGVETSEIQYILEAQAGKSD